MRVSDLCASEAGALTRAAQCAACRPAAGVARGTRQQFNLASLE